MNKITCIILFLLVTTSVSAHEFDIISNISVETDYLKDGAVGFNITYKYNFLSLEEYDHNDSILKNVNFSIVTTFFEDGNEIEAAQGYQLIANDNGNLQITHTLLSSEIKATKFDNKINLFVPYAALKLTEGNHTIAINALLSGKDGKGKEYEQTKKNQIFYLKNQHQNYLL